MLRLFTLILAALSVAAVAGEPVKPPARMLVFLLAGQSNMAGRGAVEVLDQTADPRLLVLHDDAWFAASEPLHRDKPRIAGVGPGLAFARALLPHLPPDVAIGLVPAAFGGTRIEWWARDFSGEGQRWPDGATLYSHALAQTRRALQDGRLAGILWNQGESDVEAARADGGVAYRDALVSLINHLREDLNAPDVPFVAATLGPWQEVPAKELNAALLSLPAAVDHVAVVDTLDLGLKDRLRAKADDPIHYDSPSSRLLGERYAETMRPLIKDVISRE